MTQPNQHQTYMDYYTQWDCPNCDETNYEGVNRTFIMHNGLPVISYDDGAQQSYTCPHCDQECYTDDLELLTDE